ncbi:hypothetical protein HMPREF1608_02031 [Escherichia coli 908525]|nr:hypothetical protein HMPREF1608_02031 [Escherichia coli 908525]KUT30129.1 hypothetical protein AWE58_06160 [Escherichia coli]KUT47958.1 hypothetical protein AWE99_19605 [Escherichia coli]KUW45998.1 hypothetical protein AWF65_15710 [Escherichia coli]MCH6706655.1 hypothetical protein [Escherichia coli]
MQQYIHLYLTIKHHFSDISFYWKDDRVMTVMKKAVCFQQDSHQASTHERRMRRDRLIQPTEPAPIVGMIRRASVASGICARMPYTPKNIKPAIMRFRDNRSRPSHPAAQRNSRHR